MDRLPTLFISHGAPTTMGTVMAGVALPRRKTRTLAGTFARQRPAPDGATFAGAAFATHAMPLGQSHASPSRQPTPPSMKHGVAPAAERESRNACTYTA